jgi:hypothetical protein
LTDTVTSTPVPSQTRTRFPRPHLAKLEDGPRENMAVCFHPHAAPRLGRTDVISTNRGGTAAGQVAPYVTRRAADCRDAPKCLASLERRFFVLGSCICFLRACVALSRPPRNSHLPCSASTRLLLDLSQPRTAPSLSGEATSASRASLVERPRTTRTWTEEFHCFGTRIPAGLLFEPRTVLIRWWCRQTFCLHAHRVPFWRDLCFSAVRASWLI